MNFIVPVAILTSNLFQVQQCSKPAVAFSSVPTIACSNFCTMSMQTCLKSPCFYFRSMLWKQFIWQKWHTRDQFKTNLHLNCCICFIVPAVPFTLQADLCREPSHLLYQQKYFPGTAAGGITGFSLKFLQISVALDLLSPTDLLIFVSKTSSRIRFFPLFFFLFPSLTWGKRLGRHELSCHIALRKA